MKIISFFFLVYFVNFSTVFAQNKDVLVFYKTEGFWHKSIPAGYQAIEELGEERGFDVKATEETDDFSRDKLEKYELVIFLNTTGNVLDDEEEEAFEDYMGNGGNFFGIHSAADTEYEWEWYGKLVGAYFESHPKVTEAKIEVEKPDHPMVSHLPEIWTRTDEWYNYKNINPEMIVLLNLDENSYEGGKNGKNHPIAWYQDLEGGGKAIYTGGGHTIESYVEPAFREHLLKGILFAFGEQE